MNQASPPTHEPMRVVDRRARRRWDELQRRPQSFFQRWNSRILSDAVSSGYWYCEQDCSSFEKENTRNPTVALTGSDAVLDTNEKGIIVCRTSSMDIEVFRESESSYKSCGRTEQLESKTCWATDSWFQADSSRYVCCSTDGSRYSITELDLCTLQVAERKENFDYAVGSTTVKQATAIVHPDGRVTVIDTRDPSTCEKQWKIHGSPRFTAVTSLNDSAILLGDETGLLHAFDIRNHQKVSMAKVGTQFSHTPVRAIRMDPTYTAVLHDRDISIFDTGKMLRPRAHYNLPPMFSMHMRAKFPAARKGRHWKELHQFQLHKQSKNLLWSVPNPETFRNVIAAVNIDRFRQDLSKLSMKANSQTTLEAQLLSPATAFLRMNQRFTQDINYPYNRAAVHSISLNRNEDRRIEIGKCSSPYNSDLKEFTGAMNFHSIDVMVQGKASDTTSKSSIRVTQEEILDS